jgi:predicted dehydrogenase
MTGAMTPVKFGLVGYGFGGRYFHAPLLAAAPGCEILGVLTSAPDRQALVRRELPGTPAVTSLAALADAGAEAVAISTPAGTHTMLTEQALALGLAVVCDKPFALHPDAARHTVELSEHLGLVLSPYQNRRWDSDFLTVRKLVSEGARRAAARGPPAAARCWTSGATSSTRRSSCSARSPPSTPSPGSAKRAWTTTFSWP